MGSTTGRNLNLVREETGLNPWSAKPAEVKASILPTLVPQQDHWRLGLLGKYLEKKRSMNAILEDVSEISGLIESLCVN